MPPPRLPSRLWRTKSNAKPRHSASKDEVRPSMIPFSPNQDAMRKKEEQRKPGFWRRLSRGPASQQQSKKPYIVRTKLTSELASDYCCQSPTRAHSTESPPLPSIQPNVRSSSATFSHSETSVASHEVHVSSIIHRSTSGSSGGNSVSNRSPPSPHPYYINHGRTSSTSLHRALSRDFRLMSSSPRSPYHGGLVPGEGSTPPLPYSSSFPAPLLPHSNSYTAPRRAQRGGSDTETELERSEKTPKRKQKPRPVSALPLPRRSWDAKSWKGFKEDWDPATSPRAVSFEESPHIINGFAASTISALMKAGSVSKERGRRFSGGFKLGAQSSPNEETGTRAVLETVIGSPSKPDPASRAGSVSAPSSVIKPAISDGKQEKERRRRSGNDLVIPTGILAMQKPFREGVEAAKRFAAGVEGEPSPYFPLCGRLIDNSSQGAR